jgi:hypothetical protein
MKAMQRRMAGGAVIIGVLLGASFPAQASEKVEDEKARFETVFTGVDNPCTPEADDITLTVTGHAMTKSWVNDDGSSRRHTLLQIHASGAAADGTGYVGNDQFRAHTIISDGVVYITADTRVRLVSQGSDPNFDLRFKVRNSFELNGPNSTFEVIKDYAQCRG